MQEFEVLKQLGKGSFGRVLKVIRKNDPNIYAMKTIKMAQLSQKEKELTMNEVRLLASIDSPYIIKYKGAFFQQCGNVLSILMQYADGGDLQGMIKNQIQKRQRFDERVIIKIAEDIIKGLKFLHSNNIIHRDIKTGNIFFVNGVAKIGDLNLSKIMKSDFATTNAGTPYYTSPQIWHGQKYSFKCDIWSLGCLLYQMCCLKPPFYGKNLPELMKRVTSGFYDPISSIYSKKLSNLIRKCLTVAPEKRSSSEQLLHWCGFSWEQKAQYGQLHLLDTIRCPNVLRNVNNQLPNSSFLSKPKENDEIQSRKRNQEAMRRKINKQDQNRQRKYPNTSIHFRQVGSKKVFSPLLYRHETINTERTAAHKNKIRVNSFSPCERQNSSNHKPHQTPTFKNIRY